MPTITSANAIIMIGVATILPVPQQLQGFSVDDVFDTESVESAETQLGVDGILSAGWLPTAPKMGVTLQADSPSIGFFEAWFAQEKAQKDKFAAFAEVVLISVGASYTLTKGFLSGYTPMPDAKKVLQPRKFTITWESVIPTPI